MKILHLNTTDIEGGAARSAYWLHRALLKKGVDSRMLVGHKLSGDTTVIGPERKIKKAFHLALSELDSAPKMFYRRRASDHFSPAWIASFAHRKIKELNPDIVHLHWVCGGFLKPESILKIQKPILWTQRDMWAFTGGCHYSYDCERYKKSCGRCPQLGSHTGWDLSRRLWRRKRKSWKNLNIAVIAISTWLADCAKASSLFKDHKIEVIHNALDERVFKPMDKSVARKVWNIDPAKKIILFGGIDATQNKAKGFKYLLSSLREFSQKEFAKDTEAIVFGSWEPKNPPNCGVKLRYLGRLHDDVSLATLYAAADVTVIPSIQEAFGKVAIESLACGTPVACFDCSGLKDIIDHKENGYRAQAFSTEDLTNGIAWILGDEKRWREMSRKAREKIEREFTLSICTEKYLQIYQDILSESASTEGIS